MSAPDPRESPSASFLDRLLSVRREERAQVMLGVAAFFCLMFAIFLLQPLRDAMGLSGGARKLKFLWAFTLLGTMLASLAFAALSSRVGRRTFLARSWRSVALMWLVFLPLAQLVEGPYAVWVARSFYVVHAVSNVFLVSLFWALAVDLFAPEQSRRLFGLVAVGGTLGAALGSALTGIVAQYGLAIWMIVPAALLLELAVRLASAQAQRAGAGDTLLARQPLGGDALEGMALVFARPYLAGIALFTLVFGVVQTFLTLQQSFIVEASYTQKAEQVEYYGLTQSATQLLTLLVQVFLTGQIMKRVGILGALLILPVIGVASFVALYVAHSREGAALAVVTVCLVAWKGLSHATQRPAREALYVPTARTEKYKAKNFTDTFAFRGGDLAGAFSFDAVSLAAAAMIGVPLSFAWGALGACLARRQERLVAELPPAAVASDQM
jgi:AAA family ATP:ADP antiporter